MNQNAHESHIRQQYSSLDRLIEEFKKSIFEVLFVLMQGEEEEESQFSLYFENIADYFQQNYFPFHPKVWSAWKSHQMLCWIYKAFNYFQIQNYIPSISYSTFIIACYIINFFILLIILDVVYVSYCFKRKRFDVMWPLYFFRSVTSLCVTVFFLPITGINNLKRNIIISYLVLNMLLQFGEVFVCFQGWHIFHTALSLFFVLMFTLLASIVAYTYFEPRIYSENLRARQDAEGEVIYVINKVVLPVVFSFLNVDQSWTLTIISVSLSSWLYFSYYFKTPYYNQRTMDLFLALSGYYFYSNLCLLLSMILKNTAFNGGMIFWMLGTPFFFLVSSFRKNSNIDQLIKGQLKFRSGEQVLEYLKFVQLLMKNQENDKISHMLLVGFMEKHKETCPEVDCALRLQQNQKKNRENEFHEQLKNLVKEINRIYLNGLKKFPNSVKLRLSYAFFVMDQMNNKQKAFEMFQLAKRGKPLVYEEFIIYRYQKIIKDNLGDDEEENKNQDIVMQIAFKNHLTLCEQNIVLSATLHRDFWSELKEEQPDLERLNAIGSEISKSTEDAKENFYKMQKLNPNVPQAIKVFGMYVLDILNDKQKGNELIELAKIISIQMRQQINEEDIDQTPETCPQPVLIINIRRNDMGVILNSNLLFTAYFGYSKDEIVNKKINLIIPRIYHSAHDKFLKKFFIKIQRESERNDNDYINNEQINYFIHKNRYLYPMHYKMTLNLESMQLFVKFRADTCFQSFINFIIDETSEILEMSVSAIKFFNIEAKNIYGSRKIFLNTYIKDVTSLNDQSIIAINLVIDNNKTLPFTFNFLIKKLSLQSSIKPDSDDEIIEDDEEKEQKKKQYFLVTLEYLDKAIRNHSSKHIEGPHSETLEDKQLDLEKIKPISNTQFNLQIKKPPEDEIEQEDQWEQKKVHNFIQEIYESPDPNEYLEYFNYKQSDNSMLMENKQYGEDIQLRRLINNNIMRINEEFEDLLLQNLEEEEYENRLNRQGDQFQEEVDFKIFNNQSSTQLIRTALTTKHNNKSVRIFRIYTLLWIIFLIGISIIQYILSWQKCSQFILQLQVIPLLNYELIYFNELNSIALDLVILSENLVVNNYLNISRLSENMFNCSRKLLHLDDEIYYSNKYQGILDNINTNVNLSIVTYNDQFNITQSVDAGLLIMTSLASNITNIESITFQHHYIQTMINNYFGNLHKELKTNSINAYQNFISLDSQFDFELIIILLVQSIGSLYAVYFFIQLMIQVKEEKENIFFLFLDIPFYTVDKLHKKCEKFVKQHDINELIERNELEIVESSDESNDENNNVFGEIEDEQIQDKEEMLLKLQQKRRKIIKKFKLQKYKGNRGLMIMFIIVALICMSFGIFNFISILLTRGTLTFILPQYQKSINVLYQYTNFLIYYKLAIIDQNYQIGNQSIIQLLQSEMEIFQGDQNNLRNVLFEQQVQFANHQLIQQFQNLLLQYLLWKFMLVYL